MRISLLCGGPSLERGISLNSARSVMDHLDSEAVEIVPVYFNSRKTPYKISKAQLYSNTPSDFDFKISQTGKALSRKNLVKLLKSTDIVFPAMHGPFGEDGEIQRFLEMNNIPFVGSGSNVCKRAFDKFTANEFIKENGFFALPSAVLKIFQKDHEKIINDFFKKNNVGRAIVKPANGGSSIGVFSVSTPKEALEKTKLLFSKRMATRVVLEPFAQGTEFTLIILENQFGLPVSLIPTEIETDYSENQIFDFRRKYLPTRQVFWHCPPRFDDGIVCKIQAQAEQLFSLLGMRDFGRFDGWVLPDNNIWFCDFNPISGMEQNSFLFQQASMAKMTHEDLLAYILKNSCRRYGLEFPRAKKENSQKRKPVNILMGGRTSERQVSLMSGTNVWLKLRKSKKYEPRPYLLNGENEVWRLPYHLSLNHTVEEIDVNCREYQNAKERLIDFEKKTRLRLNLPDSEKGEDFFDPRKMTFADFVKESNFVFIALHGGSGENGTLQKMLRQKKVKFNGPGEKASRLCMDKWETSKFIGKIGIRGVSSIPGKMTSTEELANLDNLQIRKLWKRMKKDLDAETLIVKPRSDGCSSGVVRISSSSDLIKYLEFLKEKRPFIPKKTFKNQLSPIEMPSEIPGDLIFEKFIESDILKAKSGRLKHRKKSGWIEVTIGILERKGMITALNPSITIVESKVLTVEEKFQGGTGINLTPPPKEIIKKRHVARIKKLAEEVARKIGIGGYSRVDAFANVDDGNLAIIEINTLPGLTPSTVFYHQGLAEKPPIFPGNILEEIIQNAGY